jgi:hypothetical protein
MFRFLALCTALAIASAAQAEDCRRGEVQLETDGRPGTLTLTMHEQRAEVPRGLFRITALAPLDGVLAIYPEPRNGRTLNSTDAFAADLVTFDAEGRVLTLWIDETGAQLDQVPAGDGMLYAAYLAGGTVAAMGFTDRTRLVGWTCIDPVP